MIATSWTVVGMGVTILIAMGASFQKLRDRIDAQGKETSEQMAHLRERMANSKGSWRGCAKRSPASAPRSAVKDERDEDHPRSDDLNDPDDGNPTGRADHNPLGEPRHPDRRPARRHARGLARTIRGDRDSAPGRRRRNRTRSRTTGNDQWAAIGTFSTARGRWLSAEWT